MYKDLDVISETYQPGPARFSVAMTAVTECHNGETVYVGVAGPFGMDPFKVWGSFTTFSGALVTQLKGGQMINSIDDNLAVKSCKCLSY